MDLIGRQMPEEMPDAWTTSLLSYTLYTVQIQCQIFTSQEQMKKNMGQHSLKGLS